MCPALSHPRAVLNKAPGAFSSPSSPGRLPSSQTVRAPPAAGFVDVRGKRVLEIGCGLGLPGIACSAAGAAHVSLTDVSLDSVELARRNAALNGLDGVVEAYSLDWDEPHDAAKFELIVAADVCYEECHSAPLARALPQLLERGAASRAIVVLDAGGSRLPCMSDSVPRFIEIVAERGELRCVHDSHDQSVRTLVYAWMEP